MQWTRITEKINTTDRTQCHAVDSYHREKDPLPQRGPSATYWTHTSEKTHYRSENLVQCSGPVP